MMIACSRREERCLGFGDSGDGRRETGQSQWACYACYEDAVHEPLLEVADVQARKEEVGSETCKRWD